MHRVLLFHAGALGDLVNTLPALRALRRHRPEMEITAVGKAEWMGLFQAAGLLSQAVSLDRPGFHFLFSETPLPENMRRFLAGYDLFLSWIRSPVLLRHLAMTGKRVSAFSGEFPPPAGTGHITAVLTRPVFDLGIPVADFFPRLPLPPDLLQTSPRFSGILVHPGSGSPHKNWPAERFARSARALALETGWPIALLEGPADQEPVEQAAGELGADLVARFSGLSPPALASLLATAGLVLGNDSGISHLAGAVGARVVAVFGPTDPAVWGVRQERAVNLSAGISCAPCSAEAMKSCVRKRCLLEVTVEEVQAAAERLLFG